MDDTDALITEWMKLTAQMTRLQAKLKPVEEELLSRLKVRDPVPIPKRSEKLVKLDRAQLDPAKLQEKVPEAVWELITERKPVADRIRVAIRDKRLTEDIVTECSGRSKSWLAITKK